MKYEDFVCFVQTGVKHALGEEVQVELHHIRKNNGVELDGISVFAKDSRIAPTIYLNGFYEEYKRGKDIPEIIEKICDIYQKSKIEHMIDLNDYKDYENVREHIACKLINRDRNRELLKSVPYKKFLNLAVVVFYRVDDQVFGNGSIQIQNEHLDMWNVSEEQLFFDARKNMRTILPERFVNISKILEGEPEYEEHEGSQIPMYVLTNEATCFGAACMIFDSILKEIGEILQDDFWILPSSIHECIIIPMHESISPEELTSMIFQVNSDCVSEEEYLSDDLYCYVRDLHKLMIHDCTIA